MWLKKFQNKAYFNLKQIFAIQNFVQSSRIKSNVGLQGFDRMRQRHKMGRSLNATIDRLFGVMKNPRDDHHQTTDDTQLLIICRFAGFFFAKNQFKTDFISIQTAFYRLNAGFCATLEKKSEDSWTPRRTSNSPSTANLLDLWSKNSNKSIKYNYKEMKIFFFSFSFDWFAK